MLPIYALPIFYRWVVAPPLALAWSVFGMVEVEPEIEWTGYLLEPPGSYGLVTLKRKCFDYPCVRGWSGYAVRGDLVCEHMEKADEAKDGQ
jgi:hypothetical protein